MNRRFGVIACCLVPLLLTLAGCPSDGEDDSGSLPVVSKATVTKKKKTSAGTVGASVATSSNQIIGGVGNASPSASPTASGSSSPSPSASPSASSSASPTPVVTPTPLLTVSSVVVTPASVILYLPPVNPQITMGLPYQVQLSAYSVLSDGTHGQVVWVSSSPTQLTVSSTGLISTATSTLPGSYEVVAQAKDDLNMVFSVHVEVRSTGGLDVTVQ